MSLRLARVNELIKREIGNFLRRRYRSETVCWTITDVDVSADLRNGTVGYSVIGDEMKAREATRAQAAEKDTREQVKVKELVILDLSKKSNEVNNRLKEFSALYDVVKNERNKYVNLIQSSSQALAEMKEKIKILMNEVRQFSADPLFIYSVS